MNELRTIISWYDLDALRQASLQTRDLCLDPINRFQRILTGAHDDDTAHRLAFTVQLRNSAADLGANLNSRDLAEENRCSALP
jgi:hypothetical protein